METNPVDKANIEGKKIIWIMGVPGSGRTTQCELLIKTHNLTHLSSGNLLRSEFMSGSKGCTNLYQILSQGEEAPNELVNELLEEAIAKRAGQSDGILVDGYPMNEDQAMAFCSHIAPPSVVVCLEIPNESAISRLTIRGNFDDNRASIDNRLKIWNERTLPVALKFKAIMINAERTQSEILQDLEKVIQ